MKASRNPVDEGVLIEAPREDEGYRVRKAGGMFDESNRQGGSLAEGRALVYGKFEKIIFAKERACLLRNDGGAQKRCELRLCVVRSIEVFGQVGQLLCNGLHFQRILAFDHDAQHRLCPRRSDKNPAASL